MATTLTSSGDNYYSWTGLAASENGDEIPLPAGGGVFVTVQAVGVAGGTFTIQGSIDGTNYFTMKDVQGNDITFTAAGYAEISSNIRRLRAITGAGVSAGEIHVQIGGVK